MRNRTKKIILISFGLFFIMICTVIGIFIYIFAGIFDEKPGVLVMRTPDYKQLQSAIGKIESALNLEMKDDGVSNNLVEGLGIDIESLESCNVQDLDLGKLLKNIDLSKAMATLSQPGALNGTLLFTKDEVNAFIDSALSADKINTEIKGLSDKEELIKVYDAFFKDGRFTLKISVDPEINSPFGKYCNIVIVFTPQVIDHHLEFELHSTNVGSISLPVTYLKNSINNQLRMYEQSEDGEALLSILTNLKIDNDSFELKYDLQKLSVFTLDKLPQIKRIKSSPDKAEAIMELFQ